MLLRFKTTTVFRLACKREFIVENVYNLFGPGFVYYWCFGFLFAVVHVVIYITVCSSTCPLLSGSLPVSVWLRLAHTSHVTATSPTICFKRRVLNC